MGAPTGLGIHPPGSPVQPSARLRKNLNKVKSAAALLECGPRRGLGSDGRARSAAAREPGAARPPIRRRAASKWQKALQLRSPGGGAAAATSALDAAMAEMAKLCGAAAVPDGGSGVGAATRAVLAAAARGPETEAADDDASRLTPAEARHALHDQLAARAADLRSRLDRVAALQAAVDARPDPRLRERDRVAQNARQGLELMAELAREARQDACERALRLRAKHRRDPPHFIAILSNDGLNAAQQRALADADALVAKHAPKKKPYRAPGYAVAPPGAVPAAPSPLGSKYHVLTHD